VYELSSSSAVSLEKPPPNVGDAVVGELEGGIEAERLRSRRVVSPRKPVEISDEVLESVAVVVMASLERLAALPGLRVEDRTAESDDVVDVVEGTGSVMLDAGRERAVTGCSQGQGY
jgi:hypothetical protein